MTHLPTSQGSNISWQKQITIDDQGINITQEWFFLVYWHSMFASDPHKPSSQRRMNIKSISTDDEDFVHKSTFQLTRKKGKKISGWGKNHAHFAVELKSRKRSSLLRSCCECHFDGWVYFENGHKQNSNAFVSFFCCAVLPLWLSRVLCLFLRHIHATTCTRPVSVEESSTFLTLFRGFLREISVEWALNIQDNWERLKNLPFTIITIILRMVLDKEQFQNTPLGMV